MRYGIVESMTDKSVIKDTAVYAAILKMDEQEDGSLLVHGKATDDTLDSDQQVCDPQWLAEAMPEWFKYGNIREQHSSIAAGVATEYKAEGSEHFITAHVVDPGSVAKVKAGVLKGFSIGIRRPRIIKDNKALGGRIAGGEIVEISLVDRPANPACTLTMAKTIGSELVQVEEFTNTGEGLEKMITATELVEMSKTFAGDVNKYDQAAFDSARTALATLIQVEAGEMAEGSDETFSLACLLSAVHNLLAWYDGEVREGEVMGEEVSESMEMADAPEVVKEDEMLKEELCKECGKAEDACKCAEGGFVAEEKSASPDEVQDVESPEDDSEKTIKFDDVRALVADVVKELLTNQSVEQDEVTKADNSDRIKALEMELAQVKSLAAPSGPKRFGAVSSKSITDISKEKAEAFRAKASLTSDKELRDGYIALARDLEKSITTN